MMYQRGFDAVGRCFENGNNFMHGRLGMLMMGGMALVAVIVIAVIVILVKKAHKNNMYSAETSEATELLNTRFVKGEITEEEYAKIKKVLGGK